MGVSASERTARSQSPSSNSDPTTRERRLNPGASSNARDVRSLKAVTGVPLSSVEAPALSSRQARQRRAHARPRR